MAVPSAASVRLADHAATGGLIRGHLTGHCISACRPLGRGQALALVRGKLPGRLL